MLPYLFQLKSTQLDSCKAWLKPARSCNLNQNLVEILWSLARSRGNLKAPARSTNHYCLIYSNWNRLDLCKAWLKPAWSSYWLMTGPSIYHLMDSGWVRVEHKPNSNNWPVDNPMCWYQNLISNCHVSCDCWLWLARCFILNLSWWFHFSSLILYLKCLHGSKWNFSSYSCHITWQKLSWLVLIYAQLS